MSFGDMLAINCQVLGVRTNGFHKAHFKAFAHLFCRAGECHIVHFVPKTLRLRALTSDGSA